MRIWGPSWVWEEFRGGLGGEGKVDDKPTTRHGRRHRRGRYRCGTPRRWILVNRWGG